VVGAASCCIAGRTGSRRRVATGDGGVSWSAATAALVTRRGLLAVAVAPVAPERDGFDTASGAIRLGLTSACA
jgi:hypothetical protein